MCFCGYDGFWKILGSWRLYKLCHNYFWLHILKIFISFIVSIAISFINFVLKKILRRLANFEKYKDKTDMNKSLMTKFFVAMWINLGLLLVCTNVELNFLPPDMSGKYGDTNRNWFFNVGGPIIMVLVINCVISLFYAF